MTVSLGKPSSGAEHGGLASHVTGFVAHGSPTRPMVQNPIGPQTPGDAQDGFVAIGTRSRAGVL